MNATELAQCIAAAKRGVGVVSARPSEAEALLAAKRRAGMTASQRRLRHRLKVRSWRKRTGRVRRLMRRPDGMRKWRGMQFSNAQVRDTLKAKLVALYKEWAAIPYGQDLARKRLISQKVARLRRRLAE